MKNIKIDCHADTIEFALDNNYSLDNRKLSFNLVDVEEKLPYIQFLACFIHDKYINRGYKRTKEILNYYFREEQKFREDIVRINRKSDIYKVINENKLGTLLTIENGLALDGKEDNIYNLYKQGIRLITITWNGDNQLGAGNQAIYDFGLTSFGKKCINIMNEINMIIDVSHSSPKTFWDILSISNKPIIASHSNVYSLCNNRRNITDIQIKEIAKTGGLIGVTYCSKFLTNKKEATIKDIVRHIEYIGDLVGIEYICVGSDFDGVDKKELPENLKGVKDINKLEECMLIRGFSKENIQDIMGKNLFNFINNNLE